MSTLFWAGGVFAPKVKMVWDGEERGVQEFLQERFLGAWVKLAEAVRDCEGVVGLEVSWLDWLYEDRRS